MPSPRKRSQKLPLYHNNSRKREDPLKILLAWVALLAVASTIWSLLHHHRRSAPEVDIHPSLIHYDARGGALLNINGTEPPEYARRDWQHLGTFRGAKGCLDAARGPGAAPCRSLRQGAESQLFLLARNGRLIVGGTVGEDPMRCVVAQDGGLDTEPCAVGATTHAIWTHADDRTLRHRDGSCIIAARADLVVVGDCQAATLDERTWFLGRPLPRSFDDDMLVNPTSFVMCWCSKLCDPNKI